MGAAAIAVSACNPLLGDPVTVGGEFDQVGARYSGPADTWTELAVFGASSHTVYALAVVLEEDLTGPLERDCMDPAGTVAPCLPTVAFLGMPNQRVVPGDGSAYVRLMTVWPGERVGIVLVCVDPSTQELGCPPSLRTALRAVDDTGARVGDLIPA